MTITGQSALGRDEIDRMMRDAEAHAEEDRQRRAEAEARNQADGVVYQTEKLLRDQGDNITLEEKTRIDDALREAKEALSGSDIDRIRSASETLMAATSAVAQRMYQEASASSGGDGAAGGAGAASDDEVVDAEIVDEGA